MEQFQEFLTAAGMAANQNKYLGAIRTAFERFMPFIIVGAIGTLWSNVICNDSTGLGALFPPVMKLAALNPAFNTLNFITMGCMSVFIAVFLGMEIGQADGLNPAVSGAAGLIGYLAVLKTSLPAADAEGNVVTSLSALSADDLGSSGLFTAMIMSIFAVELLALFTKNEHLKIRMPEQVPAGVANSFAVLIPLFLTALVSALIGLVCVSLTGLYLTEIIFSLIQKPLTTLSATLPGALVFSLVSTAFWSVGLHGDNMIGGIVNPLTLALLAENTAAVEAGTAPVNIMNFPFWRVFFCTGGTGMVLGLTIAIFLVGKREENRSMAKLALLPNLFNIGEINMFGLPVVLNPVLIIPFILSPMVSIIIGYALTSIGFCPVMYLNIPWTMPPFLMAFLAAGASVSAGLTQLIALAASTLIYLPFVKIYERQQAKQDE